MNPTADSSHIRHRRRVRCHRVAAAVVAVCLTAPGAFPAGAAPSAQAGEPGTSIALHPDNPHYFRGTAGRRS